MTEKMILLSAVLISFLGIIIIGLTLSNISDDFTSLVLFSIGLGLFFGPLLGIALTYISKSKEK